MRPAIVSCAAETQPKERCGRYELYWPHWLAERALPPVRQWVNERCAHLRYANDTETEAAEAA